MTGSTTDTQFSSARPEEADDRLRKSLAYKRAFENYMRTGEPIRLDEVKARAKNEDRPTTHYIWTHGA